MFIIGRTVPRLPREIERVFFRILVVIIIPLLITAERSTVNEIDQLYKTSANITTCSNLLECECSIGMVHVIDTMDGFVMDDETNMTFINALAVQRVTEYCQWDEFVTSEPGGQHQTYGYYKYWQPMQINSFLFDSPAAHHNPHTNRFQRKTIGAKNASLSDFNISSELLSRVQGKMKRSSEYIYLNYIEDHRITMARTYGMILEGTILDYQIGHLISFCNAGDIRIHYNILPAGEISVVGKIDNGTLVSDDVGFVTSGRHHSDVMVRSRASSLRGKLWLIRVLIFLFAFTAWKC